MKLNSPNLFLVLYREPDYNDLVAETNGTDI